MSGHDGHTGETALAAGPAPGDAPARAAVGAGATLAPIVLVHGVGFGPETLPPLAAAVAAHGGEPIVVARRGYGARDGLAPPELVGEHAADVLAALDGAGLDRAIVAGMSGGATIALALALAHADRLVCAVAHEPAVGRFSPELREGVAGALRRGGGVGLARMLAGEDAWSQLPAAQRALVRARAPLIEADARAFMQFEPELPAAGERPPLVCTVGARSGPLRWAVAERLAEATGAPIVAIDGCGHLPQLDAPDAFAAAVVRAAAAHGPLAVGAPDSPSAPPALPLNPMPT